MTTQLSLVHGPPLAHEPGQGPQSIPAYLAEVCARHGGAEAIVMQTPQERISWSYNELWQQARAVAKALIAAGLGRDGRVGVLMANRPEYLASLFGIAMAGGVTVALSTFSTRDELEHLVKASAIQILLFDDHVLKQDFSEWLVDAELGPYLAHLVQLESVTDARAPRGGYETWADFLTAGSHVRESVVDERTAAVSPGDIAGIFFSSGTTSLPKGIVHAHRAFCVQWWRWPRVFAMREPVRSWTGNGFFWSGNISMTVGTAFSTGGAIILQPAFDADSALKAIEAERVTCLLGRPHQWARVQNAPRWKTADLSSLKYVTKGDLILDHPSVTTTWTTPNAFGTTETMTICTAFDADTSAEDYAGSVGGPLPGNTLKIVDQTSGEIVPVGTSGEMCIKGPTLMQRYLGKDTGDCLDAEGFYHTGDGGHVDATGRFFWSGRLSAMIKTGGANVAPDEVDAAIASFAGVKRSQTVGVDDALLGEMVVSCIVPLDGACIDEAALNAHLRERIAAFKVPRRVLLLSEADFPLTGNEKPMVAEIRQLATARLAANG